MKTSKALVAFLFFSQIGLAATVGPIQLKTGEMGFLNFLQMVSEKLDIQIDASGLGSNAEAQKVNVPDAGPLNSDRAKAEVLSILYLSGYNWIYNPSTNLYRVLNQRDARDQELPIITESKDLPDNDLIVTYFMKVAHASPEFIARNIRSFMPAASRIIPFEWTQSIIITDSARNLSKLKKLIEKLDTPQAAQEAKDFLAEKAKENDASCPPPPGPAGSAPGVLIALFSLIALVMGFLARGYVIRRIEGGL
jgi:general secretion pathway protein D